MTYYSSILLITFMMYQLRNRLVLIQAKMKVQTEDETKAKDRTKQLMKIVGWITLAIIIIVSIAQFVGRLLIQV